MTPELKRSIEQLAQLQGVIEKLERERDEAQAKCAEMREALEFCKRCGFDTVDKIIEHALGGDRGKGFVRVWELEPLRLELHRLVDNYLVKGDERQRLSDQLARLEALVKEAK